MSISVDELAELTDTELAPQAVALLAAIRQVEESDLMLRVRLRADLGLNSSDLVALRYIHRSQLRNEPARPRDLGRRLAVTSAAATNIADRLCRAQLVEKRFDPTDGRGRILVLTAAAKTRLDEVLGDTQRMLNRTLGGIAEQQAEYMVSLLHSVSDALDSGAKSPA